MMISRIRQNYMVLHFSIQALPVCSAGGNKTETFIKKISKIKLMICLN